MEGTSAPGPPSRESGRAARRSGRPSLVEDLGPRLDEVRADLHGAGPVLDQDHGGDHAITNCDRLSVVPRRRGSWYRRNTWASRFAYARANHRSFDRCGDHRSCKSGPVPRHRPGCHDRRSNRSSTTPFHGWHDVSRLQPASHRRRDASSPILPERHHSQARERTIRPPRTRNGLSQSMDVPRWQPKPDPSGGLNGARRSRTPPDRGRTGYS